MVLGLPDLPDSCIFPSNVTIVINPVPVKETLLCSACTYITSSPIRPVM